MPNSNDRRPSPGVAPSSRPDAADRLSTFERYRGLLFAIAYRMLGSVADAEDMLQDAFLRWQQAAADEIRSPRAFLVTIVSRLCVNHLQSARVRRETYVGQWLPEPLVAAAPIDGTPEAELLRIDDSLSMAFLVLLERLTPMERAVFLLREVFEYEYDEVAATLGRSEVHCRQILRRARQHIAAGRPRFDAPARKRSDLLERFLRAAGSGDIQGLVAMLADDAVLHADGGGKAIAIPNIIHGADRIARAVVNSMQKLVPKDLVARIIPINGGPGLISYREGKPFSVVSLDIREERIRAVYIVTNPDKLARLPEFSELPEEAMERIVK